MAPLSPASPLSTSSLPPSTSLDPASLSSSSVRLGLWNANGLSASTIHDVLRLSSTTHVLFITETWLLPSSGRLNTSWSQFHTYGVLVEGGYRESQGVSALVSPLCPVLESLPMCEDTILCGDLNARLGDLVALLV